MISPPLPPPTKPYCGGGPHFKEKWQRNTKEQIEDVGVDLAPGEAQMKQMFLCMRNSNYDLRKRQPINKVHKSGAGHSKVAKYEV
jgi:hypothetical protein